MEYIVIYSRIFDKKFLVRKADECIDRLERCDTYYDNYVKEEGKGTMEVEGTGYFWRRWIDIEGFKNIWENGYINDAELTYFGNNLEEAIEFLLD